MGSKSSCHDIFMDEFETKQMYPHVANLTLDYFRFVDDIFINWIGSKDSLFTFFKEINTVHESIKFDCKYSLKVSTSRHNSF